MNVLTLANDPDRLLGVLVVAVEAGLLAWLIGGRLGLSLKREAGRWATGGVLALLLVSTPYQFAALDSLLSAKSTTKYSPPTIKSGTKYSMPTSSYTTPSYTLSDPAPKSGTKYSMPG